MKKFNHLAPYKNQFFFTALFIVIAVLFMTLGFWKTLFLVVLTGLGFTIGLMKDENRSIYSILATIQAFFER